MFFSSTLIALAMCNPGATEETGDGGATSAARKEPVALDTTQQGSESAKENRPAVQVATRNMPVPKIRRAGETLPSYRVRIRTKGGRKFTGVVCKDLRFHRRVHAGEHHKADVYSVGEAFTLKFVDGLDGEVRLSWTQLARLEVREVFDHGEIRALFQEQRRTRVVRVNEEAIRFTELERQRLAASSGQTGSSQESGPGRDDDTGDEEGEGAGTPVAIPDDGRPSLLVTFPPEEGWGLSRKEGLEWGRTVLGQFPSEQEQSFLDQWNVWEAAQRAWRTNGGQVGAGSKGVEGEGADAGSGEGEKIEEGEEALEEDPVSSSSAKKDATPPGQGATRDG